VKIIALGRQDWAHWVVAHARARRGNGVPYFLTSANGNVLSRCARSQEFRELIEAADAVDADGQPIVVASRVLTRTPIPERCATTDFFHDVAKEAETVGASIYLLGATEEVNRAAAEATQRLYPRLRIAGRRNGFFDLAEEPAVIAAINAAGADVVWVGLGVPTEQSFVVRNRAALTNVGALKTCGGLFDFVAGKNSRAPKWMRDLSLEWLYRLALEPRRLFWRYAVTNVHTLWLLIARTADLPPR
jgi:N-acetylglucosaminyldiphosphoundecaprenol N-acetyl-beta-D-mannosaminyltransferase